MLKENERCDRVNDDLSLIQKTDGLVFGTDALLLAAYIKSRGKRCAELGSGTGIISLLLLKRDKANSVTAYELQEEYADLTRRNAELNSLSERLSVICGDIRNAKREESFDLVFTNPPYMKADSGSLNREDKKSYARHEMSGDISDFCKAARNLLRFGGSFYAVYRPDRLTDIISPMRECGLEPKRMTFVHANRTSEASMVLIEAKRGGKSGMILTRPLIIYEDRANSILSEEMKHIDVLGSFPPDFSR